MKPLIDNNKNIRSKLYGVVIFIVHVSIARLHCPIFSLPNLHSGILHTGTSLSHVYFKDRQLLYEKLLIAR